MYMKDQGPIIKDAAHVFILCGFFYGFYILSALGQPIEAMSMKPMWNKVSEVYGSPETFLCSQKKNSYDFFKIIFIILYPTTQCW